MIESPEGVMGMASNQNRYKLLERLLTIILCTDAVVFIVYLVSASAGILWLKVVTAVISFALSAYILWVLYASKEIGKQRSLWITTGSAAIALCLLVSLIVNYPYPK